MRELSADEIRMVLGQWGAAVRPAVAGITTVFAGIASSWGSGDNPARAIFVGATSAGLFGAGARLLGLAVQGARAATLPGALSVGGGTAVVGVDSALRSAERTQSGGSEDD